MTDFRHAGWLEGTDKGVGEGRDTWGAHLPIHPDGGTLNCAERAKLIWCAIASQTFCRVQVVVEVFCGGEFSLVYLPK